MKEQCYICSSENVEIDNELKCCTCGAVFVHERSE